MGDRGVTALGERWETPAARLIASEIAGRGPITFRRFMELALLHPRVGYYARPAAAPGAPGDYLTSPELHSGFAALICCQLEEMWRHLGAPERFWLVELGPGSGSFLADVLEIADALFPRFAAALQPVLVEASDALRRCQAARLAARTPQVRWLDLAQLPAHPLGPGCVFANEVLDALPVHRVTMTDRELREVYVTVSETGFEERLGPLSTPALGEQIVAGGGRLTVGQSGEVNLDAPELVRRASGIVDPGYLLLVDYGDPAATLYGLRYPSGTLRCYWRHTLNRDPYRRVGLQDITAHVDLTAVTRAAEEAGLALIGATRQTRLLRRLGLDALAATVCQETSSRVEVRAHLAALMLLADPRELGRLAALVFGRGVPAAPLSGFTDGSAVCPPVPRHLLRLRSPGPLILRSVKGAAGLWQADRGRGPATSGAGRGSHGGRETSGPPGVGRRGTPARPTDRTGCPTPGSPAGAPPLEESGSGTPEGSASLESRPPER